MGILTLGVENVRTLGVENILTLGAENILTIPPRRGAWKWIPPSNSPLERRCCHCSYPQVTEHMTAWDFKGKRQNLIRPTISFYIYKSLWEDLHYPHHIPPVSEPRLGAPVLGETEVQGGDGSGEQDSAQPDHVMVSRAAWSKFYSCIWLQTVLLCRQRWVWITFQDLRQSTWVIKLRVNMSLFVFDSW